MNFKPFDEEERFSEQVQEAYEKVICFACDGATRQEKCKRICTGCGRIVEGCCE